VTTYDERLYVPLWWWLTPVFFLWVIWLTAERIAGGAWAAVVTALAIAAVAGGLLAYGSIRVRVTTAGLEAGPARLPLDAIGETRPLDAEAARALRGPEADARARLVLRGYIPTAVQVQVLGKADPAPYWYVSTRHPHRLAAALQAAVQTARRHA
jgi:Protein of unknown function (DUF3093)